MHSNFEFLNEDILTEQYYKRASEAELSYTMGLYSNVLVSARTIAENMAKDVADKNYLSVGDRDTFDNVLKRLKLGQYIEPYALQFFYDVKNIGNTAAHTLKNNTKDEALSALKHLYALCVWFVGNYYDRKVDPTNFHKPEQQDFLYQTTSRPVSNAEKNLIYIQTADNSSGKFGVYEGNQKIGKTGVGDLAQDNTDNSPYLRQWAKKRIDQYMKTSGVPTNLEWAELAYRKSDGCWFSDHDVHHVLERSGIKHSKNLTGDEWFETDLETAKKAIKAVKEGKDSLDKVTLAPRAQIVLRPEQQEAVDKTIAGFKSGDKMLWNAKMRFGKTLTALQLIKEEKYKKVLIMTHRPVVSQGWFDDFNKIGMPDSGYIYGSKDKGHKNIADLENSSKSYIYFASIQDLGGSEAVGGKVKDKNRDLFAIDWDLIIIDEAHEATQTELTQNIIGLAKKKHTKELDLSGTPFNIISDYDEDHVFTWDYTMEQEAKSNWTKMHPGVANPYAGLPKVSMFTFEMNKHFNDPRFTGEGLSKYTFNFKEFFRTNNQGKFIYENDVKHFLDNITNPGPTNYPFATREFRNRLLHTLWVMPGIKEANALEDLLKKHPVFGEEYKILNVVRHDKSDEELGTDNDAEAENKAIAQADKEGKKTITLTVRKLTTGATIPKWTGVLFLSNISSSMQYLQTAFRAQTPYSSPEFGKKENCYIFDFAPDRALTIMAESTSLATGVGKIQTKEQKAQMARLMNFLPIIGENNQQMKPLKVDSLLSKIKRAYAERAVRTGFDDDSIYSDELLLIKDADLQEFNDLKGIIGTTKKDKKPMKVDVNHQGLDEEEYDTAEKARKKKPLERSKEEQEALDKVKALKKQRRTMISILRGISIRIPMMIYGMDIEFDEDVSIKKFVNSIDDVSWEEFMPKGITKALFNKFVKYYDADVFIEAGKIIRRQVKELDKADPLERVEKIADIFDTFRNPDKETVLTPWRVVNMHLGKTIGGLSFFDKDYQYSYEDGKVVRRWVETEYTDQTLNNNAHVLEINSKTGLYPLYVATSIYWREFKKMNDQTAGKFSFEDELLLWQRILRENIFLVAKTPMAKEIARRTLAGYHSNWEINSEYVENIVEDTRDNVGKEAKKVERMFGNMKFDVVIGNPPYQQESKGTSTRDEPIYHLFVNLAYKLADTFTLITPGRYLFNAGSTPKDWNKKMLTDIHNRIVLYNQNSDQIFPRTDIKGGVAIVLHDENRKLGPIGTFTAYSELNSILKKVSPFVKDNGLTSIIYVQNKFNLDTLNADFPEKTRKDKRLESNIFSQYSIFTETRNSENQIKIFGLINNKRLFRYVDKKYLSLNHENLYKYKVLVPKSNGSGALGEVLSTPLIGEPLIGYTRSFIGIGAFSNKNEAENLMKYVKSKFARTMLGVLKVTQDNNADKWRLVPLQNFTSNSDIDWSKSIPEIDQQLYKKYDLSQDEINFIETKVQAMS
ncbi:Eco57I restriction-modification methylase domain-containing protein [Lactobacillus crispatus]|uniref:Eco57I restriction-modification methylase domain-containing protein n=1 Tax=Lactobacillus crispatus TaxID=47770 RepID=UPI0029C5A8C6|nr:Eco57I restriction-modification methylase domain-containing protein [Lactobacillus crispatus]MDX5062406.1 Eco57I restriction-modification methylase domain-containing protein [Lactobacillus crispatus]MDX5074514.1 Eco57I restriction-modification methylase domain-containing protein [Lactobacillus crispatus]MDX5077880.1 Eco57I restriction-modification methylase domain-containing protein [Lactobacillus crispatus]MDX5089436.1 Eco57I restriction-modification methylase domain-containing protein [Lac